MVEFTIPDETAFMEALDHLNAVANARAPFPATYTDEDIEAWRSVRRDKLVLALTTLCRCCKFQETSPCE